MKKLTSVLLTVCLLAVLAFPTMAAKVDLAAKAEDAINELAKYNSTPVGEKFNVKTMMGYTFGVLCADDTYFVNDDTGRYEWYEIPAIDLESKMNAFFADGQTAISEMQAGMKVNDYSFEYTKVQPNGLQVYEGANYYFNKYLLDRTELQKGNPIKSKEGYVVENPNTFTVNGYVKTGGHKYDAYATRNDGALVKFTVEWAGGDIKFVSTASAASVPANAVKKGTQEDLEVTTTTKATTTTTTKGTTTTTTKNGGGTTTTTTKNGGGVITTTTTEAEGTTTTTTTKNATIVTQGNQQDVGQNTPDEDTTTGSKPAVNTTYIIIGVVLGVVILAVIAAVIIVLAKMKKKPAPVAAVEAPAEDEQE